VLTNTLNGKQYVDSSINLITRIYMNFMPSIIINSTRSCLSISLGRHRVNKKKKKNDYIRIEKQKEHGVKPKYDNILLVTEGRVPIKWSYIGYYSRESST